jgi:hypothetical protein
MIKIFLLGLLMTTAAAAAATESKVNFEDRVRSVTVSGNKIKITFRQHAAIYSIDKSLLKAAKAAQKSGKSVQVTVDADSRRIEKLISKK